MKGNCIHTSCVKDEGREHFEGLWRKKNWVGTERVGAWRMSSRTLGLSGAASTCAETWTSITLDPRHNWSSCLSQVAAKAAPKPSCAEDRLICTVLGPPSKKHIMHLVHIGCTPSGNEQLMRLQCPHGKRSLMSSKQAVQIHVCSNTGSPSPRGQVAPRAV